MARRREPLGVKIKDGIVTLRFSSEGWTLRDTHVAKRIGRNFERSEDEVARAVGAALTHYLNCEYPDVVLDPEIDRFFEPPIEYNADGTLREDEEEEATPSPLRTNFPEP